MAKKNMASSRGSSHDPKKEGLMEAVGAMAVILFVIFALVWFLASHKIVYYSTPGLRWLGLPLLLADKEKWAAINEAYVFFRNSPGEIPLQNFIAFANACLGPLSVVVAATCTIYLFLRATAKNSDFRRKLDPMQAATEIAKTFPAIVPVLHLGPDLVADKLPLWRRQTFPEDIWTGEKLLVGDRLLRDRVETYFRGGEAKDGPHQKRGGRRWSKMLGYQVVDLIADAEKQSTICFPDRFSPQGKVLFALLAAHAFGGRDGKQDYQKACDQLNRSCAGQVNGLPNLTVAQWLYSKYRMNGDAKKLFAVHHWEYTYLFSLFQKAKRNGKATHTDFIWLKPLDRIFFYVLNTVGRAVPHAESAAVFAMVDYETKCAIHQRLPLRMRKDGTYEANICVYTAVDGMHNEFVRYQASTDDNDDWWKDLQTWDSAKKLASQTQPMKESIAEFARAQSIIAQAPAEPANEFDDAMSAQRKKSDAEQLVKTLAAAAGASGIDMS